MEDLRAITSQESGIEAWKKRAEGVSFPFFLLEKEKKTVEEKRGHESLSIQPLSFFFVKPTRASIPHHGQAREHAERQGNQEARHFVAASGRKKGKRSLKRTGSKRRGVFFSFSLVVLAFSPFSLGSKPEREKVEKLRSASFRAKLATTRHQRERQRAK